MKNLSLTSVLLMGAHLLLLSQYGQEWGVGPYGRSSIRFREDIYYLKSKINNPNFLVLTNNANICNQNGDMYVITNGGQIADSNNIVMQNGDTITEVLYSDFGKTYGFPTLQGSIFLPKKGNQYYVFTLGVSDKLWATGREQPDQLFYAVVDMDANNGKGAVISKLNLLYNDTMCDGHLTAVRHGNGRDWWVVANGFQNNVLHKYLVTPDTVLGPFFQAIGTPRLEPDAVGMACFSKDGSKYATGTANSLINVFDFDRCSGIFSNAKAFQAITYPPYNIPYSLKSGCNGLCFSPNNRYLYLNSIYTLTQHDLEANDIKASGILLAQADSTFNWAQPFEANYLTPLNFMVLSTWGDGHQNQNLHVIELPDLKGDSCLFKKEYLYSGNYRGVGTLPNMINYDLGALQGCDTFYTAVAPSPSGRAGEGLVLFPNPAQTQLTIETNEPTTASVSVYDAMGKMVWQQTESHGKVNMDVQTWQAGLYVVVLKTERGVMAKKFLKE